LTRLQEKEAAVSDVSPARKVLDEVVTWAGITTRPTSRGATAILFEGHELGHVHANRGTLDLPLSTARRAQVLEAGRAKEWFSGWVTKQIASRTDADDGVAMLRESYDALRACFPRKKLAVTSAVAARLSQYSGMTRPSQVFHWPASAKEFDEAGSLPLGELAEGLGRADAGDGE
jgi:hypothetical protein